MDDIIKLLQQLIESGPKPKGGIASSQEGIDFLGKALTKEQRGSLVIVNSRLTDASRFKPFDIRNVGRDKRYRYMFPSHDPQVHQDCKRYYLSVFVLILCQDFLLKIVWFC